LSRSQRFASSGGYLITAVLKRVEYLALMEGGSESKKKTDTEK
jgi:hypothetical protein